MSAYEAVTTALRERLLRVQQRSGTIAVRLQRLAEEYDALPVQDDRSADELLGYDETGLPR
jgi:antitoxin VapB